MKMLNENRNVMKKSDKLRNIKGKYVVIILVMEYDVQPYTLVQTV